MSEYNFETIEHRCPKLTIPGEKLTICCNDSSSAVTACSRFFNALNLSDKPIVKKILNSKSRVRQSSRSARLTIVSRSLNHLLDTHI